VVVVAKVVRSVLGALAAFALLLSFAAGPAALAGAGHSASWGPAHQVLAGPVQLFSSAVDQQGNVHLAIVTASGDLHYATNRSGSWSQHTLLTHGSGIAWSSPAIAVDDQDRVHIAVVKMPSATGTGQQGLGIWYLTDMGRAHGSFPTTPTRLAPDGEGRPRLAAVGGHLYLADVKGWCCTGNGTVQLRTDASGSWTVATVAHGGDFPRIGVGSDGHAQIVYWRTIGQVAVFYGRAATMSGGFQPYRVPGSVAGDEVPKIALGSSGRPTVLWSRWPDHEQDLMVARRTGTGWQPPSTAAVAGVNALYALAVDANNQPLVAFGQANLHARVLHLGTWEDSLVASGQHTVYLETDTLPGGGAVVAWSNSGSNAGVWVSSR
jgi:hypothetical protein